MSFVSVCCGARKWHETDICSKCKEHTDFYDDETGEPEEIDFSSTHTKQQKEVGNGFNQ